MRSGGCCIGDRLPHERAGDVQQRVDLAEFAIDRFQRTHGGLRIDEIDAADAQRVGRYVGQCLGSGAGPRPISATRAPRPPSHAAVATPRWPNPPVIATALPCRSCSIDMFSLVYAS
jgi:hypothetical protein